MTDITAIPISALKEIELFDVVILGHGFEQHMRDYYFIIESGTNEHQGTFKVVFTHCFDLKYRHKYATQDCQDLIRKSWSDNLIQAEVPENEHGYWWGQGFTCAYPGFSYDPESEKARELSEITEKPMYAAHLETDHYEIQFVFHDFRYTFLNSGHSVTDRITIPGNEFRFKE